MAGNASGSVCMFDVVVKMDFVSDVMIFRREGKSQICTVVGAAYVGNMDKVNVMEEAQKWETITLR